jgi:hypothetical protein
VPFRVINNRGFHITFANGVDVSVQFGIGSYTENHFNTDPLFNRRGYIDSVDAEVAVIDRNARSPWFVKEYTCEKCRTVYSENYLEYYDEIEAVKAEIEKRAKETTEAKPEDGHT